MKWLRPARASSSSREPVPIQKPIATERTPSSRSVTTRSPSSSVEQHVILHVSSERPRRGSAHPGFRRAATGPGRPSAALVRAHPRRRGARDRRAAAPRRPARRSAGGRERTRPCGKRSKAMLGPPGGRGHAAEGTAHGHVVGLERRGPLLEDVGGGRGGEPGGEESLVHPVARERVDEARGVPDHERAAARQARLRGSQREAMASQVLELRCVDPVGLAAAPSGGLGAPGLRPPSRRCRD